MLGVKMAKASLQFQVLRHWPHACRTEAVIKSSFLGVPLPHGIESAFDDQSAQINRSGSLVYEALLARSVDHQVSRAFEIQSLAYFVHQVDRISHARGRHVAVRMARRHHAGEILGEQFFAFWNFGAGRRESRHAAIRRARRRLNAGVRVLLVVVANNQAVVVAIERAGNRSQTDVRCAAVPRFANNVRELALPLSLADHRLIGGGDTRGKAARAADLRVRPWHVVWRA